MKSWAKQLLGVSVVALAAGCGGGGSGGDPSTDMPDPVSGPISPSDPDAVMGALLVKVGDSEGTLMPGDIPPASNDPEAPTVTAVAEVSSSNGSTAQVPLSFNSSNPIAALFLKVAGSDSVFEVDVSGTSTKNLMAEQSTSHQSSGLKLDPGEGANVEVTLPSNLQAGSFIVEFSAADTLGRVAQKVQTTVEVATVGSGTLQFSLSWDSTPDLDLHVTEPNGERIFFANPQSASGGVLDFDDTDGTGPSRSSPNAPNAVENIFWEGTAPSGQYIVEVDYFSGNEPTNFVVTVSRNGAVIERRSVNNFSGTQDGSRLEVVRITN